MSVVGEIKRGRELGRLRTVFTRSKRLIFCKCPDCGKERWLLFRPQTSEGISRCPRCSGEALNYSGRLPHGKMNKAPNWKGGRYIDKRGYVVLTIAEDDPYVAMALRQKGGNHRIVEHRYVMAKYLRRCLTSQEHVHHKNGIKDDNRIENLELISPANHILYDKLCAHCKLRREVRILRKRVEELETATSLNRFYLFSFSLAISIIEFNIL